MKKQNPESTKKIMSTYIYKDQTQISERPESLKDFLETIKQLYNISKEDFKNCIITYKNKGEDKPNYILNEEDYNKAKLISEDIVFTIIENKNIDKEDEENQNKIIINDEEEITEKNKKKYHSPNENMNEIESDTDINFLKKPKFHPERLKYIDMKAPIDIYVNLYEIKLSKQIKLFQYPFTLYPEPEKDKDKIIKIIIKNCYRELKAIFKNFCVFNRELYTEEEIKEVKTIKTSVFLKNKREDFTIEFKKYKNMKIIRQQDVQKDALTKQYIELLIKDILHSNKNLEFYKDAFVMKEEKITIDNNGVKVDFYPGFTTSFVETERGNFLNVSLKHKIVQSKTILYYLNENDYKKRDKKEEIREHLKKCVFKDSYKGKNYKITDIDFDRNPENTSFINKENGMTMNLMAYYKAKYDIEIEDKKQPLIIVCKGPPEEEKNRLYFIPELCYLLGLEEDQINNGYFMNELANSTKIDPYERVQRINKFINLMEDNGKRPNKMSPKEKMQKYGITISSVHENFKGYYMNSPTLLDGNNKEITKNYFPVVKVKNLNKWYFVYEQDKKGKENYKNADKLYNTLCQASKSYKIKVNDPIWIEVPNKSQSNAWINQVEKKISRNEKDCAVLFLINNEKLYQPIKVHSLCKNGYVSQVVKSSTVNKSGIMSICSKILLQLNAKLGGISNRIKFDKEITDRKLMVIGIDSSHIKGGRTGVGMVATLDNNFSDFYNRQQIIIEENKKQLDFCVSNFIEEASKVYLRENKSNPKSLIIYRQGVSLHQKELLKKEIKKIDFVCKTKGIKYYYILVNTKTNYKIFHIENGEYFNPYSGLLVLDGITNRNFFEFYIQPQEVTEGSSTPTCFHVAYGDLDFPEIIPKFTFDLCHIYSNWNGAVRIPNVIKAAEKLSKMTAKYTKMELNAKLKRGQSYL